MYPLKFCMEKRHVQAELTVLEYEGLRRACQKEGRTMKQALREAALDWARAKQARDDPLYEMVGLVRGKKGASKGHDEIYDEA